MSVFTSTRVWKEATVSGTRLVGLLAMADMSDQDGVCWPSIATLTALMRLKDERQTYRVLSDLVDAGEIVYMSNQQTGKEANRYLVITGYDDRTIFKIIKRRELEIDPRQIERAMRTRGMTPGKDVTPTPGVHVTPPLAGMSDDPSCDPSSTSLRDSPAGDPRNSGQLGMFGSPPPAAKPRPASGGRRQPKSDDQLAPATLWLRAFRETVTGKGWIPNLNRRQETMDELYAMDPRPTPDEVRAATELVMRSLRIPPGESGVVWVDRLIDAIPAVRAQARQPGRSAVVVSTDDLGDDGAQPWL